MPGRRPPDEAIRTWGAGAKRMRRQRVQFETAWSAMRTVTAETHSSRMRDLHDTVRRLQDTRGALLAFIRATPPGQPGRGNAEAAATKFALFVDACVAQVGTLQVGHPPRATPSPVVGEGSGAPSAACVPASGLVGVPVVDGEPSQRLPAATVHACGDPTARAQDYGMPARGAGIVCWAAAAPYSVPAVAGASRVGGADDGDASQVRAGDAPSPPPGQSPPGTPGVGEGQPLGVIKGVALTSLAVPAGTVSRASVAPAATALGVHEAAGGEAATTSSSPAGDQLAAVHHAPLVAAAIEQHVLLQHLPPSDGALFLEVQKAMTRMAASAVTSTSTSTHQRACRDAGAVMVSLVRGLKASGVRLAPAASGHRTPPVPGALPPHEPVGATVTVGAATATGGGGTTLAGIHAVASVPDGRASLGDCASPLTRTAHAEKVVMSPMGQPSGTPAHGNMAPTPNGDAAHAQR